MLFRTAFVLGTVCGKELAYMRARKDGGWDADCQTAFDGLRGVAFASADADVERSGDGGDAASHVPSAQQHTQKRDVSEARVCALCRS